MLFEKRKKGYIIVFYSVQDNCFFSVLMGNHVSISIKPKPLETNLIVRYQKTNVKENDVGVRLGLWGKDIYKESITLHTLHNSGIIPLVYIPGQTTSYFVIYIDTNSSSLIELKKTNIDYNLISHTNVNTDTETNVGVKYPLKIANGLFGKVSGAIKTAGIHLITNVNNDSVASIKDITQTAMDVIRGNNSQADTFTILEIESTSVALPILSTKLKQAETWNLDNSNQGAFFLINMQGHKSPCMLTLTVKQPGDTTVNFKKKTTTSRVWSYVQDKTSQLCV